MFHCGNKDLRNSARAFLNRGAVCILTSSYIKDIMDGLNFIEDGKIPQERKYIRFQVALYTSVLVLIISSTLTSIVFCLLHHKESPQLCWAHGSLEGLFEQNFQQIITWNWTLDHCSGFVEEDDKKFLTIEQSGRYYIYAQVYRIKKMTEPFTLKLYKEKNITLDQALGPKDGEETGIINFGRPFLLNKGDRLYCSSNFKLEEVMTGNRSYWGLYKM